MEKEYSRAEIALTRLIERVMSDILSDKYDCKVKIRYLEEEYGYPTLAEDEHLVSITDEEGNHKLTIIDDDEYRRRFGHEPDYKRRN